MLQRCDSNAKQCDEMVALIDRILEEIDELPVRPGALPFAHWPLALIDEMGKIGQGLGLASPPIRIDEMPQDMYLHGPNGGLVVYRHLLICERADCETCSEGGACWRQDLTKQHVLEVVAVLRRWRGLASGAPGPNGPDRLFLRVNEVASLLGTDPYEISRLRSGKEIEARKGGDGHMRVDVVAAALKLKEKRDAKRGNGEIVESDAAVEKKFAKLPKASKPLLHNRCNEKFSAPSVPKKPAHLTSKAD